MESYGTDSGAPTAKIVIKDCGELKENTANPAKK
jgi:hypothetical protein